MKLAPLALVALFTLVAAPARTACAQSRRRAEPAPAPESAEVGRAMRFAPTREASPYQVSSADANTLVVVRARSSGAGLEGFVVDMPALLAELEQRVLVQRGLDSVARLSAPEQADRSSDPELYRYRYRFSAPFEALRTGLELRPLEETSEERWLITFAVGLALCMLGGLYALYRMVAVQVHFAERRQNFVAAVSHELKTPLTAIRMYGELLRDGLVDSDHTRQEYYGLISTESERLSRLVENVLRLARLEHGGSAGSASARPLHALRAAVDLMAPRAAQLGFELCLDAPDEPPVARHDPDALTQVLVNLLDNALKYARDAADRRIDVRLVERAGELQLSVRDRGPGVPARELAYVLEPFYRVGDELTRRHEGVGLGLALVKRMVEQMGGRVACANAEPGFVVTLSLPRSG